ncbi:MAG: UDP-N-acetylmuramoyl-L-alanyl-D-glutamate--2,6-diaminopimelate ligase [Ignavibacteria bacterium]|nr:UDP-N-acetylmuramoyl-L-alanyl-D-glutamate--2,6-diaminopimelate ligase [Ignavibacteria bacterium]
MKLSEIINQCSDKINMYNFKDFEVTGLVYDSRKVKPGNIFFAIKGLKDDGNKFIAGAVSKRAGLILNEEEINAESGMPLVRVKELRKLMATISGIYYGNPSEKLKLIGITGTNGKTTISYLIQSFLNDAGYKTGLIGTINYQIGNVKLDSSLTTPDSVELNMMLNEMTKEKMDYCVMEVSSIALVMERVYGLNFDSAVFTNLTSEHLDFHKDMKNYFESKKILFDNLKEESHAISNCDDNYGKKIFNDCRAKKFFYSMKEESNLRSFNEKLSLSGIEFDVKWNGEIYKLKSNLTGRFNIYNILASVSTVLQYDLDMESIQKSLLHFQEVNGRFNRVKLPNGAIAVIDYSHTSDSLKNAIESAREIVNEEKKYARVITIFGCGGNKDRTKRPVMGDFATELSDYSIITSDNPRFEDPMEIISEIISGIKTKNNYEVIENREDAIKRGIELSKEGDIVLICGKGHETYQEVKGVKSHFDDKEIAGKYSDRAK